MLIFSNKTFTLLTPMFPIEALVVGKAQSQLLKKPLIASIFEVKDVKIAIIGKGNVGTALCNGLSKAGHETKFGHRDPAEPVAEAAKWGEVIILAVPHDNADDAREAIKPYADGKTVIDVMNAIGENMDWELVVQLHQRRKPRRNFPKLK